jgi:hypothetical protein
MRKGVIMMIIACQLLILLALGNYETQSITQKEHLKRITYADKNFSENTMEGSNTDRGRIYIELGAPDKIKKVGAQIPIQKWIYNNFPGVGDIIVIFIDKKMEGVFSIVPWYSEDSKGNPIENEQLRGRIRKALNNKPDIYKPNR